MAVALESPASGSPPRRARRGFVGRLFRLLVVLGILAGVGYGGWWGANHYGLFSPESTAARLMHKVSRGDLIVTVTEDGNLESASNIDIRCQVFGGATIKDIVVDGTFVKQGEKLVELDSAAIDEQILTQRIQYEKARAVRDQAVNDLVAAKIALREYVEGTFVKELQTADSAVTVANENLRSARNTLDFTERMYRKGYVTTLQKEAQEFSVKKAQLDVDLAETAKKVLQEFTFEKMKNELETKVATAEAKAKSEEAAFQLEDSKLKRLENQKANCIIMAPQAGMVVYANESSSGRFGGSSDRPKIEEGAAVREGQVILRVPDLGQMQVKVTVHESKVESIRAGMPASIRIQNRRLTGYVTSVANQPESTMMFSSGVKKYGAFVRIDGEQSDLKPGMTAEVKILIDERKNILTVPVQCVVELGGKFYVWKVSGNDAVKTAVEIGAGDDQNVEVKEGLAEGDLVLQNPPERQEGSLSAPNDSRGQFGPGRPAGTGAPPGGPAGSGGAGGAGGGSRTGRGMGDLMALDKDGDKKISRAEAPEQMQMFFDRMDTDGDGFITDAEAKAAAARRAASGGGGPGGPAGPPQ